jgi:Aspartyl protease
LDSKKEFIIMALIDLGCTHSTIDSDFVCKNGLTTTPLEYPQLVRNADGTENKEGRVIDCLEVMMEVTGKDHQERIDFAITKLGSHKMMFLGYDWIHTHTTLQLTSIVEQLTLTDAHQRLIAKTVQTQ